MATIAARTRAETQKTPRKFPVSPLAVALAMAEELRLGWVQYDLVWEDVEANIARVDRLLAGTEAAVWVLPEMWSTGFSMEVASAEPEGGPAWQAMRRWAETKNALIIGSVKVQAEGQARNRAYLVFPDGQYAFYDKRHLFRLAGEHQHFVPGHKPVVVEWQGWRLAVQICYDLRFPVWSARRPGYDYDVLIYVANWPAVRHTHWSRLLPARAIENQAYVLGVNRVGRDGQGHLYLGGSALWSPKGEVLLHSGEAEGAFVGVLSYPELVAYRRDFPFAQDADDFQLLLHPPSGYPQGTSP